MQNKHKKFIVGITEHRIFGHQLIPYIIEANPENSVHTILDTLSEDNISRAGISLSGDEKQIVAITHAYSEREIFRIFSKEKSNQDFMRKLSEKLLVERIRPYIEKKLLDCLTLIKANNIPLYFKDKRYNTIYQDDAVAMEKEITRPVFNFIKSGSGTRYFLTLLNRDQELNLTGTDTKILTSKPCHIILNHVLYQVKDIDSKKLLPFRRKEHIEIPRQSEPEYYRKFILNTIKQYKVHASGFKIQQIEPRKKAVLAVEQNLSARWSLMPVFYYDNRKFMHYHNQQTIAELQSTDPAYVFVTFERDRQWEKDKTDSLLNMGLMEKHHHFMLPGHDEYGFYDLINWVNHHAPELEQAGFTVSQSNTEKSYFKGRIKLEVSIEEQQDWFDVNARVFFGPYEFPFTRLRRHILQGIREFELPSKEIAIIPEEWFSRFREVYEFGKTKQEVIQLKKFHFQLINNKFEGIARKYYEDFLKLTRPGGEMQPVLPQGIQASLRSYQLKGYSWLSELKAHGFGGCLADDMGLGKTIQTLALLQHVKEQEKEADKPASHGVPLQYTLFGDPGAAGEARKGTPGEKPGNSGPGGGAGEKDMAGMGSNSRSGSIPEKTGSSRHANSAGKNPQSLIVMPTSLIHNWENEIHKFTPGLTYYVHAGLNRTRSTRRVGGYDVILTTYGIVRNDLDFLKELELYYLILDESQVIKNPDSKIYKSIIQLNSRYKLVLTGTPIENSLIDLWSQLNFLNRGLLGSIHYFKNHFVKPIEKQQDDRQQQKLQLLIQPFILRRTKHDVARDLPPLTEQLLYSDMTDEQRKIYEEEKSRVRNLILENIRKAGVEKSAILILRALGMLRQLANHPRMVNQEYTQGSGKFDDIIRNLNSLIAEGHKVLIFSSFVKHLSLISTYLDEESIPYARLIGSTTNRKEVIRKFQEEESCKVFLISLKAGGFGLNLTAADYVFVVDPWWNPASEIQAISRAHRIGQQKNVFVYRFITSDSIEEKIQRLQQKKSRLANIFINSNNPFKGIREEDIETLFE